LYPFSNDSSNAVANGVDAGHVNVAFEVDTPVDDPPEENNEPNTDPLPDQEGTITVKEIAM
jgi:hypothetical protein